MRVLIAEDREIERRVLCRAVEELGHQCLTASDGYEAWELFLSSGADVLISDWVMPGLEGPELCRRVRAHPGAPYTYVILLTVLDDPPHTLAGMEAGADDYLTKPLELHKLQACLVAAARVTALHHHVWQREAQREQTLARFEALLRVARRCAAAGDAERLLTELLTEAVVLLGGTAGVVSRWDEQRTELVPLRSTIPAASDPSAVEVGRRLSSRAAEERTPVVLNPGEPVGAPVAGVSAAVAVPLLDEGRPGALGAIAVTSQHPTRVFMDEDVEILQQLARIGAAALAGLDNARVEGALVAFHAQQRLRPHTAGVPSQPIPLIGREREVQLVQGLLLRGDTNLVTLTGPAGTGKTRLALAVAASLVDAFGDGVFVVDLAPVLDAAQVLPTIARTLGIRGASPAAALEQLLTELAEQRRLLVLDNFEQVLAAGADVAELAAGCRASRVLVTSRVPLRVGFEREVPVPPLDLPDPTASIDLSALERSSAVALFVTRARAANPDFALTEANAAAVAETCRLLDGLPLAIELAAARTRVLSPNAMPARLESSLELLGGWAADRPKRHQTLRAAIAWSYALLSSDEQRLFRQLAVFAGGFTLEAAAAVVESADGGPIEMLEAVAELVMKNLVSSELQPDGETRFRLLRTIRAYALERLAANDERERAQRRHAAFFQILAERAQIESRGHDQAAWLQRLTSEHDNLRAAVRSCMAIADTRTELRLVAALAWFWEARGQVSEGRSAVEAALARPVESAAPRNGTMLALARANAQDAAGRLALAAGDLASAQAHLATSLAFWRREGNQARCAATLAGFARVRNRQASRLSARALAEESLALSRAAGDRWAVADALDALGEIAADSRDWTTACSFRQQSVAIWRELDDRWRLAQGLEALARLAAERRLAASALRLASAAATLRVSIGIPLGSIGQSDLDRALAPARHVLGEEAAATAWADGSAMPLDELLGDAFAPPPVVRSGPLAAPPPAATRGGAGVLTERQRSVAELIAVGMTNLQIADELQLSERTVETHVRHILEKLLLVSRTQIAAWVVEQRLTSDPAA